MVVAFKARVRARMNQGGVAASKSDARCAWWRRRGLGRTATGPAWLYRRSWGARSWRAPLGHPEAQWVVRLCGRGAPAWRKSDCRCVDGRPICPSTAGVCMPGLSPSCCNKFGKVASGRVPDIRPLLLGFDAGEEAGTVRGGACMTGAACMPCARARDAIICAGCGKFLRCNMPTMHA